MAKPRKPVALRDHPAGGARVLKRRRERSGGWGRNARKAKHVKQGDLSDDCDGVHVPDSETFGTDRYEEPVAQESEDPYER